VVMDDNRMRVVVCD